MKIKLGDMTAKQLHDICSRRPDCTYCPLKYAAVCEAFGNPSSYEVDKEIDLSDEEVKDDDME